MDPTCAVIDLNGPWEYSLDPQGPWSPITLPSSWWLAGLDTTGPVWFRRQFDVDDSWQFPRTRLRFEGVDYSASVSIDGVEVGSHIGGFAPFVFDLNLDAGPHEIVVVVDVPEDEYGTEFPHTKQALRGVLGHHDARPGSWGPRGQERCAGGIWGSVRLTGHELAALEGLRPEFTVTGPDAQAHVQLSIDLHAQEPVWATVRVRLHDRDSSGYDLWTDTYLLPGLNEVQIDSFLPSPRLWWTWDHGEPFLYTAVTSVIVDEVEHVLDERSLGIRDIGVDEGWHWQLNGRPVFIRGSNYIGSQWLSGLSAEQTDEDVSLAVQSNLNLLRVHAHVTVPSFYDACDRQGVLVWQDLPMQWGYRDDAATYSVARSMVHDVVALHGWRPSVAFWCAHNEAPWNEPWMAEEAGKFVPDQNQRLDHELAALFRKVDPSRPALANSGAGDGHTYPGWYWGSWTDVHELPGGAFVSEYGAQAVPNRETLLSFLPEGSTADDWQYHGFQHYENEVKAGVTFDMPLDHVIEKTQAYQALIIQNSTETYRRKKRERVQGVIQFMLVDPWPCISWSVLDIDRKPKLGFQALTRAMQPVLPSIEAETNSYSERDSIVFGVWWINDHPRAFRDTTLSWRLVDGSGATIESADAVVHMKADDARRVMQAGPFTLAVGAYRLMTSLSRGGEVLGENEWAFTVSAHDEAATS
jgi:beta-mannosidase